VVFFTLPVHELSHAFAAYLLGDNTAKYRGRLSLNPLVHLDPLGSVLIVLFGFGWAKPVPVNLNNFKRPKLGMAITSFAGPLSNIISSFVLIIVLKILDVSGVDNYYVIEFFMTAAYINISLAIFNLIPIPPLDGSKILNAVLPFKAYYTILKYERYMWIILIAILATDVLAYPLTWLGVNIFNGLGSIVNLPFYYIF
ncbi:MAG: site-2 protease family protein, partial [Clostridia bacterium]|nr:site-2 protease family protein [Clostridia bacterium]